MPRYGAGISMNRVLRLTPSEYAERQVERVLPSPESGLLGLHTVNRARLTYWIGSEDGRSSIIGPGATRTLGFDSATVSLS